MSRPRLLLTVVGDEIGPSLSEMITFCAQHQVRYLDLGSVDGQNLLSAPTNKVAEIGAVLDKAGLRVPSFASPVLRWPAAGKKVLAANADFSFDAASCPVGDPLEHACDVAGILGATRLRVFSYLGHDNFRATDLLNVIERLLDLSSMHVTSMHLENAPVCNIGSIPQLADFFRRLPELLAIVDARKQLPLHPLPDIGNSYGIGAVPTDNDIAILAPHVEAIRLKDYRFSDGREVPLGDGDVPWRKELERLLAHVTAREIVASIETHCAQDAEDGTARSVAALRQIAADIGVEVA
jgi:sugar phosphate isomerase/epimerase